jgi:hypothetical protein
MVIGVSCIESGEWFPFNCKIFFFGIIPHSVPHVVAIGLISERRNIMIVGAGHRFIVLSGNAHILQRPVADNKSEFVTVKVLAAGIGD